MKYSINPFIDLGEGIKSLIKYVKNEKTGKPKLIGFGLRGMEDYRQHKDKKRRASYLARAKGIKDKQGRLTYMNKNSANYWAVRKLWAGP